MVASTTELTCDLAVEARAAWVYEALTTAKGLSVWWGHRIGNDLLVGATADLLLSAGCIMRIRVDQLDEPSLVSWTCVGGVPEWELSTLCFELEGRTRTTLLRFTHRGWRWRVPGSELVSSGFSWPRHLTRLRALATVHGDRDARYPQRRS